MNWLATCGILIFFTSLSASLFVIVSSPKKLVNRIWSILTFLVALWGFGLFRGFTASNWQEALLWDRFLNLVAIWIPFTFLHFVYAFLDKEQKKLKLIQTAYLFALLYFIAMLLFPTAFILNVVPQPGFTYYPLAGNFFFLSSLFYAFCVVTGIGNLFFACLQFKGNKRNQIMYLLLGMFIGFSGGATTFPLVFGFSLQPYGTWGVVLYVILITYAITKHELMDISIAISRTSAYGTSVFCALLLAGAAVYSLHAFAGNIYLHQLLIVFFFTLLVAVLFEPIRKFVQTPLAEKWITSWYDSDVLLNKIAKALTPIFTREEAFRVIASYLDDTIKIKEVNILLRDKNTATFSFINSKVGIDNLSANHPFIANIQSVVPNRNLPAEVKEAIKEWHLHKDSVYLPLFSSAALEGIIILGQKKSEDHYSRKDLLMLETVMSQTKIVLDRIQPYEQVKSDFEASQKKLYDAEIKVILERSHRLASLGLLTAGVTHEIRNPLTVLRLEIEDLDNHDRDAAYLREKCALFLKHITRIEGIVSRMLGLAKVKDKALTAVNLNEIIEGVLTFFPASRVIVKKELGEIKAIRGNAEELQQVFVNFIQNALQAMQENGILTIKTMMEGEHVVAEVADTGKGMSSEIVDRIFDPFFSTKHDGTGLGLSIVYRIIREHGGEIKVESEVAQGTMFKVVF